MDIPLGTANSKLYEKNGLTHYKISPISGMQINFYLNAPVNKLRIEDNNIFYDSGSYKLKLEFIEQEHAIYKLRIKPIYFWVLPFGITFCEISKPNKEALFAAIANS
ncbi:hypothetical protein C3B51_20295 [Pseudoalteromonas rubra]|uniref:Uncharacterized protein n=1 Tax=Pseudoalteromonas rubra TaxID=43658 RepID=A0A4Q7DZW9_9GAMM|nr:hypothetical protein [Pseudoalteromonas rubra]RZM73999.1 hypothetical protein C3B51_20295 [Pseudoalteromonas rubra]